MSFNGTVVQALLMMNGREINDEIGERHSQEGPNGVVAEIVKRRSAANPRRSTTNSS